MRIVDDNSLSHSVNTNYFYSVDHTYKELQVILSEIVAEGKEIVFLNFQAVHMFLNVHHYRNMQGCGCQVPYFYKSMVMKMFV